MNKPKNITVEISGMSCASCAKRIEDAIGNINGVSESIVNFATRKATVTGCTSAEEIYKIIEGLGYGIVKEETPAVSESRDCAIRVEEVPGFSNIKRARLRNKHVYDSFQVFRPYPTRFSYCRNLLAGYWFF